MGYRGAAFTRRRHRFRAVLLALFAASFGSLVAWVIALEVHFYGSPFEAATQVGWWFAATPVRILEGLIFHWDRNWNPADAPPLEIASMCVVNGIVGAIVCWILALWLNRSDAGYIRNLVRSFWHVERPVFSRKILILSGWGGVLGIILTLAFIGLAYLLGRGSDSGAFLVWGALCVPLHAVCAVIGKNWPDFSHGPTVANILAASLVNGVLLTAIFACLPLTVRFLLADSRVTSQ